MKYLKYKKYIVCLVTHPSQPVEGENNRQGKRHFTINPEIGSKSLCNMQVRYLWPDNGFTFTWEKIQPKKGAMEFCATCVNKIKEDSQE